MERIKSGIIGFDSVIEGGYVDTSVNVVTGGAGTGKTLFALSYMLNGRKHYGDRGLYFSIEEADTEIIKDVEAIGLDYVDKKVVRDVRFVHTPLFSGKGFMSILTEELNRFKPKRVVIDSISALAMPMEDNFERRKEIYRIIDLLKKRGCTTLLTAEMPSESDSSADSMGRLSTFDIEEFLGDSVTVLHYAGIGGEADRALRVLKMRRTNHMRGPIPMQIGRLGVKVLKSKYNL